MIIRSNHLTKLASSLLLISAAAGCCGIPVPSFGSKRSFAIPNTYPLGSTVRDHYHQMEMNGEASDFVMHRHEFVRNTAELNCAGKDHVMEIAARMRSNPFPVLVERSENNSDPELDQLRRNIVTQILTDFGNGDAANRCIVATPCRNKHQDNGPDAENKFGQREHDVDHLCAAFKSIVVNTGLPAANCASPPGLARSTRATSAPTSRRIGLRKLSG